MLKTMIGVLALAATLPAAAETRAVRYDDLNLASSAGVERLERRIHNAARDACRIPDFRVSLTEKAAGDKCVAETKARAMEQVARLDLGVARGG